MARPRITLSDEESHELQRLMLAGYSSRQIAAELSTKFKRAVSTATVGRRLFELRGRTVCRTYSASQGERLAELALRHAAGDVHRARGILTIALERLAAP